MKKLLVFDLDGTLCPLGKGLLAEDIARLKELEQAGYGISICSGKTTFYLSGLTRQLELEYPYLVGENGATYQFGPELPPERYYEYPVSKEAKAQIRRMRDMIDDELEGKIWYQPNTVVLTPFPKQPETFEVIQKMIDDNLDNLSELIIYRHVDCFDFIPNNINKYNGVKYLAELLEITADDMIAFGNGANDIPMFEFAGTTVGIGEEFMQGHAQGTVAGDTNSYKQDYCFETIGEALDAVGKLFG